MTDAHTASRACSATLLRILNGNPSSLIVGERDARRRMAGAAANSPMLCYGFSERTTVARSFPSHHDGGKTRTVTLSIGCGKGIREGFGWLGSEAKRGFVAIDGFSIKVYPHVSDAKDELRGRCPHPRGEKRKTALCRRRRRKPTVRKTDDCSAGILRLRRCPETVEDSDVIARHCRGNGFFPDIFHTTTVRDSVPMYV